MLVVDLSVFLCIDVAIEFCIPVLHVKFPTTFLSNWQPKAKETKWK